MSNPQDDFDKIGEFEQTILGERGHKARLYQLVADDGSQVGKIRDAVNAKADHVYASEVVQLLQGKPNTAFRYEIHAYFGEAARNCSGQPFVQDGGTFTTNGQGKGFIRVVVGEPGNPNSKNPIPIPPAVTGKVIGFRYWVVAVDGSAKYSTSCKLVFEPSPRP